MPDDHSDLVPLLPIPNRTVKRVSADDSADPRVKVGHRQAITAKHPVKWRGVFFSAASSAYGVSIGCIEVSYPCFFSFLDRLKKDVAAAFQLSKFTERLKALFEKALKR